MNVYKTENCSMLISILDFVKKQNSCCDHENFCVNKTEATIR